MQVKFEKILHLVANFNTKHVYSAVENSYLKFHIKYLPNTLG